MTAYMGAYGLIDRTPTEVADVLQAAAGKLRTEPAATPEVLAAVADLLQTLSWMPSLAHHADLAAALRVARAVLGGDP